MIRADFIVFPTHVPHFSENNWNITYRKTSPVRSHLSSAPIAFPSRALQQLHLCASSGSAWPILFVMLDFLISWLQFPLLKLSSMTPIEWERNDPGIDPSRSQSASQLSGWKRWQGNLVSNKLKKRLENSQFYLGPSHWGFSLSRELKVKLIVLFLILFLLFSSFLYSQYCSLEGSISTVPFLLF